MTRERARTPGEPGLRPEILFTRSGETASLADFQSGEGGRASTENRGAEQVVLCSQWRVVLPADSQIQRQIRPDLPIVLHEQGGDGVMENLGIVRRPAGYGIEI